MAKPVRAVPGKPRMPSAPAASERGPYIKGVWEELKKVIWPTRPELTRMTGIVTATVVIFAGLIGLADYGLGLAVRPLYAGGTPKATTTPAPAPAPQIVPSVPPGRSTP